MRSARSTRTMRSARSGVSLGERPAQAPAPLLSRDREPLLLLALDGARTLVGAVLGLGPHDAAAPRRALHVVEVGLARLDDLCEIALVRRLDGRQRAARRGLLVHDRAEARLALRPSECSLS